MCGIYAGEDISDIERFIIFIFLLCYYYTGIDEQILNHSISFPQPNKTERGHLVMPGVFFVA